MYDKPQLAAGGAIPAAAFIKLSTAADFTALQAAGNTDQPIGISADAAIAAPFGSSNDVNAAEATDEFPWYGLGETCLLTLGSGGCTRGDKLMSDTGGLGVTWTSGSGHWYGAQALESGAAGEKVRVMILIGVDG